MTRDKYTLTFLPDEASPYDPEQNRGTLCIKWETADYYKPIMIVDYFPIMRCSRDDWHHLEGREASRDGRGIYAVSSPHSYDPWRFRLWEGGETTPIKREEEPIPAPKTRVETRYRYGKWDKYLKSRGWVEA